MPLVSISIVVYNGEKWIKPCLESVNKQSYQNWQVLIIDNNSQDKTVALAGQVIPQAGLILNKKNLGFAGGHNLGISQLTGKYILCLNQDVVLHQDFLKEAVKTLETDKRIGALQGKLYKWIQGRGDPPAKYGAGSWGCPGRQTLVCHDDRLKPVAQGQARGLALEKDVIDTTGLMIFKNRRVINRGQGEIDRGQYNRQEEIFGADGAAPVYRRRALDSVFLPLNKGGGKEFFDQDFFAYKEDIDLAWRIRLAGWKAVYRPKAIAWHGRGAGPVETRQCLVSTRKQHYLISTSNRQIVKQHQQISKFCRLLSWKNQRLMQIKNEMPNLFLRDLPAIVWKELKTMGYICLREPWMLKSVIQFFKQAPRAWQKRKTVMAKKSVSAKEIKRWFV